MRKDSLRSIRAIAADQQADEASFIGGVGKSIDDKLFVDIDAECRIFRNDG